MLPEYQKSGLKKVALSLHSALAQKTPEILRKSLDLAMKEAMEDLGFALNDVPNSPSSYEEKISEAVACINRLAQLDEDFLEDSKFIVELSMITGKRELERRAAVGATKKKPGMKEAFSELLVRLKGQGVDVRMIDPSEALDPEALALLKSLGVL